MTITKVLDRDIGSVPTRKDGTRSSYATIPAAILDQSGIESKAEIRLVDLDNGERGILLTKFVP